jgi:hypothetical protein
MPTTQTSGPLACLFREARTAIGQNLVAGFSRPGQTPAERIDRAAGALLASMGLREIASDLNVRGLALLNTAVITGLQRIAFDDPTLRDLDDALDALEDLLRRSATVRVGE